MGLGLHGGGVGAAKYIAKKGAEVLATDLKTEEELESSLEKLKDYDLDFVLGKHRKKDFQSADVVIKNPAVSWDSPYLKEAQEAGAEIETAIGIFFKETPSECIGVTGTKGKSTTASLIYEILKRDKDEVFLAGNIGRQALNILPELSKNSLVVLELSSWQLEGLSRDKLSPHVSVVTNVFADHLNRYQSFSDYKQAKQGIVSFQGKKDYAVLNYDNEHTRQFAQKTEAGVIFFGQDLAGQEMERVNLGAYLQEGQIFYQGEKLMEKGEVSLCGRHNLFNILAALSCVGLYDIDPELAREELIRFEPPEGRLQLVGTKRGLEIYNDTASTNPRATIEAINSVKGGRQDRLVLIAGGEDKDLDYSELADEIEREVDYLFLLAGGASRKLSSRLSPEFCEEKEEKYFEELENLLGRVLKIKENFWPNKKVKLLFSPGAASFNMFKNEFDRGRKFVKALKAL